MYKKNHPWHHVAYSISRKRSLTVALVCLELQQTGKRIKRQTWWQLISFILFIFSNMQIRGYMKDTCMSVWVLTLNMKGGSMYQVPKNFMNYSIHRISVFCFISHWGLTELVWFCCRRCGALRWEGRGQTPAGIPLWLWDRSSEGTGDPHSSESRRYNHSHDLITL